MSGLKAELGTATHKVMEVLGNCKKILQDGGKQSFKDDAIGEVKFTKKGLYTDKFVDSLIERSYNHYKSQSKNDFNKPNFKVQVEGVWIKDTFEFVSTLAHMALKSWNGNYDPRERNILAMEPHFDLPIERDWAHFEFEKDGKMHKGQLAIKGTIDTVTTLDPETIEVIDWKTGERKDFATGEIKDYKKLCVDPQLLLYNHALSRLYPDIPNRIMTINFLRDGGPFSMCFDEEDDEMFLDMLRERFSIITNCKQPKPVSRSRNDWKCKYVCSFSAIDPDTGKMICKNVEDTIKTYGITVATEKLKKSNFDPTFYESPG